MDSATVDGFSIHFGLDHVKKSSYRRKPGGYYVEMEKV
jgi:hypothetical protein